MDNASESPTILRCHGVTMRRLPSSLLCSSALSTFIFLVLLGSSIFSPSAFAQGSYRKSLYDSIEEKDKDNPRARSAWMTRGREAPKGQSSAALRLRAHQQKMAMRATALGRTGASAKGNSSSSGWVFLGPAPLTSDQDFYGQ